MQSGWRSCNLIQSQLLLSESRLVCKCEELLTFVIGNVLAIREEDCLSVSVVRLLQEKLDSFWFQIEKNVIKYYTETFQLQRIYFEGPILSGSERQNILHKTKHLLLPIPHTQKNISWILKNKQNFYCNFSFPDCCETKRNAVSCQINQKCYFLSKFNLI